MTAPLTVNGRTYRYPTRPTVVVCVDGCEPLYVERAIAAGAAPALARFRARGTFRLSRAVVPPVSRGAQGRAVGASDIGA